MANYDSGASLTTMLFNNPLRAGTELIWFNIVNIMVADALPGSLCCQDISTHDIDCVE